MMKYFTIFFILAFWSLLHANIPSSEREALIALYNSTDGDNWDDNSGWKDGDIDTDGFAMPGTEGTWHGITVSADHVVTISLGINSLTGSIPTELGNLSSLQNLILNDNSLSGSLPTSLGTLSNLLNLILSSNSLTGSIPSSLGNLSNLISLYLHSNSLTGSIPTELGNLSSLQNLRLETNSLTGSIPSSLGNLSSLSTFDLDNNNLTGSIPSSLGSLSNLQYLFLHSNSLTGSIPTELGNLSSLVSIDLRWNGLYTDNTTLRTFLNSKQTGGDWESTQTIAPSGLAAGFPTSTSMEVSWTPITYTGDTGGYRVFSSTTPGGPYTEEGMTADKSASSLTVDGLNPSTTYYFVVVTRTNPHGNNSNTVNSDLSEEVSEQSLNIEMQDNITAANSRTGILLQWVTASETGNAGFHVWRSLEEEGRYERMTALIIPGAGNSSEEHSYSYLDTRVESQGIYWYKVEQLDVSGCSKFFGPLRVERVYHLPEEFFLSRNYPNPFNPSTTLDYQLPVDTYVTIAVYDLLGRQIRVLVDSRVDAGYHKVSWDGTDASGRMVANGIYLIQMQTEDFRWVQKLSVIK